MMVSRRFFTLIELIITMAIIGSIAGVIGININKAMQQQRFHTEVAFVVDQLRLAQNLMLILNEDVSVVFAKQQSGHYALSMKLQSPIEGGWHKEIIRAPRVLKAISTLHFNGQASNKSFESKGKLKLQFFSAGAVMSKGTLEFKSNEGLKRYIYLSGRPEPLTATESRPTALASFLADEKLTLYIQQEIQTALLQKPLSRGVEEAEDLQGIPPSGDNQADPGEKNGSTSVKPAKGQSRGT